jgi:hypothetical protein
MSWAGEFQEQGRGGERRKTLQDGGERKAFEAVQRTGFRCGDGVHGSVSRSSPARTAMSARLKNRDVLCRDGDHAV